MTDERPLLRKRRGNAETVNTPWGLAQVTLAPWDSCSPSLSLQEAQMQVTGKEEVLPQVLLRSEGTGPGPGTPPA